MKKWLILAAAVVVIIIGWYIARRQSFTPPWAMPKYGEVTRGDIRVPITASGLIHAQQVVEVKPKASGEILEVTVAEGSFVRKGDALVVLDPDDEQRTLDRAQAEYDRAEAVLAQARVAVERATTNIDAARAQAEEIAAQAEITAYEWEKVSRSLHQDGTSPLYSDQQIHDARSRDRMARAQLQSAQIAIETAKLALQDAQAAARSQEAIVRSARKTLEDAQERLRETTIVAPCEAIVTQVYVKPGMLVQSGTQSLTGGTPLMLLGDVSKKKVIARLDEADYGRVLDISPVDALPDMPGLRAAAEQDAEQLAQRSGLVKLTVDAFPEDEFEGRIERVEPQGRLNTGSSIIQFDVHVEITDAKRHLLPLGAQAQVEFTVESAVAALRVPAEAVKTHEEQRGVWVKTDTPADPDDKFGKRFVQCRFGISDGEYTQVIAVLGGNELKEGDEIYTKLPQTTPEQ